MTGIIDLLFMNIGWNGGVEKWRVYDGGYMGMVGYKGLV